MQAKGIQAYRASRRGSNSYTLGQRGWLLGNIARTTEVAKELDRNWRGMGNEAVENARHDTHRKLSSYLGYHIIVSPIGPYNTRLRRVIRKALSGQAIKIGILGGSVSVGHSVDNPGDKWQAIYAQWWRDTFFQDEYLHAHSAEDEQEGLADEVVEWVQLVDGSMADTQSDYLQSCYLEHIDEDVDLVLVELGINDIRRAELTTAFEYLLRSLLVLPKNPAIINLQAMSLHPSEMAPGGDPELATAMYYDVPSVNIRNVLLPHLLQHPELESELTRHWFSHTDEKGRVDLKHLNAQGHRSMAEMLISMSQRILCDELKKTNAGLQEEWKSSDKNIPGNEVLEYLPRLRMSQPYDNHSHVEPTKPVCMSVTSKNHPLVPATMKGWEKWKATQSAIYYRSTEPGSTISFQIKVGPLGRARVTYWRSMSALGSVWCWVEVEGTEDSYHVFGKRLDGYWDHKDLHAGTYMTDSVAENIPPGSHNLTCRVLGRDEGSSPEKGAEFRIIAVDSA
ncbi:hypothetical protein SISNIDRAFT_535850 [Sistotremastrum niveocremeum HHB9708]|uniref:SGNH hydrolase-type esterase domain-containing protein n=1 Tax=Sistotremastrum niveocremeum HHB9708 TaxID=1314777 RepID=A0A164N9E8_9AGAM|nr:hypothetical protein SISNIDRAFT_535850 [Sistotremastrum niveocremeum HHB9708]